MSSYLAKALATSDTKETRFEAVAAVAMKMRAKK